MDKERISDCWYIDVCDQECYPTCVRYTEMKHLMEVSGIPKHMQVPITLEAGEDYESFCILSDIKDDVVEFVNKGNNLYIASTRTGNGKTSWAIKLMLKYFDNIWAGNGLRTRGLFVHVPTFLLKAKDFQTPLSEDYKQTLLDCDIVVWDDIGSSGISQYDYSQLLMYIDNRILRGKTNIYTSNAINKNVLDETLGVKLSSRIFNTSQVVIFVGKDRRSINGTVTDN